jgi:hypothetical protein
MYVKIISAIVSMLFGGLVSAIIYNHFFNEKLFRIKREHVKDVRAAYSDGWDRGVSFGMRKESMRRKPSPRT